MRPASDEPKPPSSPGAPGSFKLVALYLSPMILLAMVVAYGAISRAKPGEALPWLDITALALALLSIAAMHLHRRALQRKQDVQQRRLLGASKFAALGEVAAGMAHEINTPLGAITLSASQLKDMLPASGSPGEANEILSDILTSAERIARIVRGLKNFSRENPKSADFVFCDLASVLHESLALCEASLRSQNVEIRLADVPKKLEVQCNPTQLSQVIVNLVNNARDAAAQAAGPGKWIEVSLSGSGDHAELRITDCGNGIPPAIREKLFQPFFTTKEIGKGTGIGLNVVLGLVQSHRGEVFLDERSPNTSFVVRIPRFQTA